MHKKFTSGYDYHRNEVIKSFANLKEEFNKLETIILHGYASYTQETVLMRLQEYETASSLFLTAAHKLDYFMVGQSFEDENIDHDEDYKLDLNHEDGSNSR